MDLRKIIQQEIDNIMSGINQIQIKEKKNSTQKNNPFGKRSVVQYTLDGEFVQEFDSIKEANRALGVSEKYVSKHLRGKTKTCKGYIFKFKAE